MKLYYSKGSCSLAPHIVLEELGLPYEGNEVHIAKGETNTPEYLKLNPMGAVPVLVLEDGSPLTEAAVILQYLADLKPETGLAPPAGTPGRLRLQETLNFLATELHKGFGPLWGLHFYVSDKAAQEELKTNTVNQISAVLDVLEAKTAGKEYVMGAHFTVADAYFFTLFNWAFFRGLKTETWPNLKAIHARIGARPAVRKTLEIEGIKT